MRKHAFTIIIFFTLTHLIYFTLLYFTLLYFYHILFLISFSLFSNKMNISIAIQSVSSFVTHILYREGCLLYVSIHYEEPDFCSIYMAQVNQYFFYIKNN